MSRRIHSTPNPQMERAAMSAIAILTSMANNRWIP